MISGFCHEADENCAVLGYYAVSSGNFLLMFWNNLLIDRLFQNVGKKLPLLAAVLILKVVCFSWVTRQLIIKTCWVSIRWSVSCLIEGIILSILGWNNFQPNFYVAVEENVSFVYMVCPNCGLCFSASMLALLFAFQSVCCLDGIHYLKICRLGYEILVFFKRV